VQYVVSSTLTLGGDADQAFIRKEPIMRKSIVTAAAVLVATAAPAFADTVSDARTFTRDGETFSYTQVAKDDHVDIDGQNLTSGGTFHLVVRGKRVAGVANGVPVSFFVPAKSEMLGGKEVASR
jgi:hypothetical protein